MLVQESIRLRAIELDELPWFGRWLNDPAVRKFVARFAPRRRAQSPAH